VVEAVADDLGLANDVRVAPVPGRGVHHQPSIVWHAGKRVEVFGGLVLIGIGVKLVLEHLLG
jgi:hypothetical protein